MAAGGLRGWLLGAAILASLALAPAAQAQTVGQFQGSWVDRSLQSQYELASDVALRNTPWVGTHNSFNSQAEMGPTLSDQDNNQQLKITDLLQLDVRSIEIDLHYFPNGPSGGYAPVVCHARGGDQAHFGCTVEKTLGPVLDEIVGWLNAHPDQVLMLYFEDHLDTQAGYDAAAAIIQQKLGGLLYTPPAGGCGKLPMNLTRNEIRAAGKQAFIVSGCGIGSAWQSQIFDWSAHDETTPHNYSDFPDCGPDFPISDYRNNLIRYFEDSTHLSEVVNGGPGDRIPPATAAAFMRCGVDLTGLDQLLPGDGRLEALVWSWAPGQPKGTGVRCAVQRVDSRAPHGRWFARRCGLPRKAACRKGRWAWLIAGPAGPEADAAARCKARHAVFAVPRTGYEAQLLRLAMEKAGVQKAWLGYKASDGVWSALDQRG